MPLKQKAEAAKTKVKSGNASPVAKTQREREKLAAAMRMAGKTHRKKGE